MGLEFRSLTVEALGHLDSAQQLHSGGAQGPGIKEPLRVLWVWQVEQQGRILLFSRSFSVGQEILLRNVRVNTESKTGGWVKVCVSLFAVQSGCQAPKGFCKCLKRGLCKQPKVLCSRGVAQVLLFLVLFFCGAWQLGFPQPHQLLSSPSQLWRWLVCSPNFPAL